MRLPKIGLIGVGFMGRGVLLQAHLARRYACVAVADKKLSDVAAFLNARKLPWSLAKTERDLKRAVSRKQVALCTDVRLITHSEKVEAVVDATSDTREAAVFCADALRNRKHLVMVNSEGDLTFGSRLAALARRNGVVYTSADGDQYGVLRRLIDEVEQWGIRVVLAGNIKGFLNRRATPQSIKEEADKRGFDHQQCACFTDGTKLNIEMAILANTQGYVTKRTGMLGPRAAHVADVLKAFDLERLWRDEQPFVDYVLGAMPGGGVFLVGHSADPYHRQVLKVYKMGDGPFYVFYRPYHLCFFEVGRTICDAVIERRALMFPRSKPTTNVFAFAKRSLKAGEELDGPGGSACYGLIENLADQGSDAGLPICLAHQVRVKRSIRKGDKVCLSDVEYDASRPDFALHDAGTAP